MFVFAITVGVGRRRWRERERERWKLNDIKKVIENIMIYNAVVNHIIMTYDRR